MFLIDQEVSRVLYGCNRGRVVAPGSLDHDLIAATEKENFDLQVSLCYSISRPRVR
jgi:hypothetical protein